MRKLASFEASKIFLYDDQNDEMCNVVQSIGNGDLEKLYLEGEKHGVAKIMKDIWLTDVQRRRGEFLMIRLKPLCYYC